MIRLQDLVETRFRDYKSHVHLFDVPMFSVFVEVNLGEEKINDLRNRIDEIKKQFEEARNEIHKIGFPSMHINVRISDLGHRSEKGQYTKWAAGLALGNRYVKIDIDNIDVKVIVHEWAHIWMAQRSKSFKLSVNKMYGYLSKQSADKLQPSDIKNSRIDPSEEKKLLDIWVSYFESLIKFELKDYPMSSYLLKGKKLTLDMFQFLPHQLGIRGILKKDISVQNIYGSSTTLKTGTEVYADKIHSGWIIGSQLNSSRFETVVEGFDKVFEYLNSKNSGSNILNDIYIALKSSMSKKNQYYTPKVLESSILEKLIDRVDHYFINIGKLFNFRAEKSPELDMVKSWIEKYVYPKFIILLRSKKLLEKYIANPESVYQFLWVSNDLKPNDISITGLCKTLKEKQLYSDYKNGFTSRQPQKDDFIKQKIELMKELVNWVNSYGMTNEDEMWATAIEYFFKLPLIHRKTILKLMLGMESH